MKEQKTQATEILKHLQQHGTITSMQAIKKFGATRLSSIIFNFRKRGYEIETVMTVGKNRYGNRSPYAVYKLVKEPAKCQK
jgi:hypothetical protein